MENSVKKSRGLIFTGVFGAIYILVYFIIGVLCMPVPILYLIMPALIALAEGPVYMMLLTKAPMRGSIFIVCMLPAVLLMATGHIWVIIPTCAIAGILAEIFAAKGKYKSFKWNTISFAFFAQNIMGGVLPIWMMRDYFFTNYVTRESGAVFSNAVQAITPIWVLPLQVVGIAVCAVISSFLARALFKKYFTKAGIV